MVWAARGEQPVGPSPGGQRLTPAQTAQRVKDDMPWQPAVRELLDGLLAGAPIDEQEPVRAAPRFDAYLAAVVEHISAARGAASPG